MSDHAPKVELRPRSPEETLDALMPKLKNEYGSLVRTNKPTRLRRVETVTVDYNDAVVSSRTYWSIEKMTDDYSTKVAEEGGHLHADAKGNLVGFCPNEELPFKRVNELVAKLTKESK